MNKILIIIGLGVLGVMFLIVIDVLVCMPLIRKACVFSYGSYYMFWIPSVILGVVGSIMIFFGARKGAQRNTV